MSARSGTRDGNERDSLVTFNVSISEAFIAIFSEHNCLDIR